jgi:secreted trypsin-like serine protease
MNLHTLLLGSLGVAIGSVVACSASAPSSSATGDSAIIGGVDAKSAALDAVGALMYKDPANGGALQLLCTATLIAPNVVLTAKHCALQRDVVPSDAGGAPQEVETRLIDAVEIYFAVGADARAPKRLVQAGSVATCNVANSGFMGLGCDVSVYHLKESITDIRPLKVTQTSVSADAVGRHMSAVGYGNQVQSGTQYGTRKAGTLTVRSVRGAPMQTLFPTVDGFIDAMREAEGEAYVDNQNASLREFYATPLLEDYEAFAGASDGDAQVCHGDSGGPLLAKINGELVVQGVASGVVSGVRLPCKMGSVYAVFGPKAQELITRAVKDECAGVPAEGRCEGEVAVRCTTSNEGPRKVTRTDCSELLQRCIVPAASVDGGEPADADADAGDGGAPSPLMQVTCGD